MLKARAGNPRAGSLRVQVDSSSLEVLGHPREGDSQRPQGATPSQEPALGAPMAVGLQEPVPP